MADYRARLNRIEEAIAPYASPAMFVWWAEGKTREEATAAYAAERGIAIDDVLARGVFVGWAGTIDA